MKLLLFISMGLLMLTIASAVQKQAEVEDNEFAEFEELDEDDEDATVEEEGEDAAFEEFNEEEETNEQAVQEDTEFQTRDNIEDEEFDEDEFENIDQPLKGAMKDEGLKIKEVPLHFRTNWDSYYLEFIMIAGVLSYVLNYLTGKSKNNKLATAWFKVHREILDKNFSIVGDDGSGETEQNGILMKDSENRYLIWCSGRIYCEGMLVELKLLKRQDLVSVMAKMMRPTPDEVRITVTMNKDDMDTFVLFIGNKKIASKMGKEMNDLYNFCPERRSGEKYGLGASLTVMAEMADLAQGLIDSRITNCLNAYPEMFDYLHFSDQYSGPKPSTEDEQPTKMPTTTKVLIFNFRIPGMGKSSTKDVEAMVPMLKMVIYCIDKVKRYRLSREGKIKADKARAKVAESFEKLSHAQRQEAAQLRREDKRRQEKERLMNEDDPEKARKIEDKQYKQDMKRRLGARQKQVKIR
ncbi:coiled-coil domain-containing protein 47-like [Anneissia japonica]|uniref:coiled-coil domain-containing protein 47-like n=1 Tax=Anneissia japonica TaxID=1529436 RepID=UPI0014255DDD|nr:coiled-coil domain-containing protein 47-like [Anneissia japonica]XP_033106193.1 coiled-coil domain-containing protein 47-like [Anneissia japonica]XP_033106194.1 coiled-coil domain-containing protein 47-like [Anneissia japonica]